MRSHWLCGLLVLGALSCNGEDAPSPKPYTATWTEGACVWEPDPTPGPTARCGQVEVLEDRSDPQGRRLRLAVAVFPAQEPGPEQTPLVFLSGGPGAQALGPGWADHPLRQGRDLVVMDYRGIGASEPLGLCPTLGDQLWSATLADLTAEEEVQTRAQASLACLEQLETQGIDARHYNSTVLARDVSEVLAALGYVQWDVWGFSYGTRVAQAMMRLDPGPIRAVVLDSPVPLGEGRVGKVRGDFLRSIGLLFASCAAQEPCARAFPSLEDDFYDLVADYSAQPLTLHWVDDQGQAQAAVLNGQDMILALRRAMYDEGTYRQLPLLIYAAKLRLGPVLEPALTALAEDRVGYGEAHRLLVELYDNAWSESVEDVEASQAAHPQLPGRLAGTSTDAQLLERWLGPVATDEERQPVKSDLPVLLIGGQWDPVTPPRTLDVLQPHLRGAWKVVLPAMGHGVAAQRSCGLSITRAFLRTPSQQPDLSCLEELGPPTFRTTL